MYVKCIKSTTKLVKDATYKCMMYFNDNTTNIRYFHPTVKIYLTEDLIQSFSLKYFKPIDRENFDTINWISDEYKIHITEIDQTKIDKNLKVGDYVIPLHGGYRTIIKGKKYKVSAVKTVSNRVSLRIEGSNRWYTGYYFRKCSHQESREIQLNDLFDEPKMTIKLNPKKRKIDYFTDIEKKVILLQMICDSVSDRYRNKLDIIDWCIFRKGKDYKLNREDFDQIIDLSVREILSILETKKGV